jgi:hypothetical protein
MVTLRDDGVGERGKDVSGGAVPVPCVVAVGKGREAAAWGVLIWPVGQRGRVGFRH